MKLHGLSGYKRNGFASIPGWMHPLDLTLFDLILSHQLDADIAGDLLEIGSYHGKSAIVMGYGLRAEEILTVCDIFGDTGNVPLEGTDPYDGLTVEDFTTQYARFHDRRPDIRSMPSSELVLDRDYRFIHIDGGHAYEVVRDDIDLCTAYTAADGVIALDDYRTVHTPGTSAAIWQAAGQTIYPFLASEVKLYAATSVRAQIQWAAAAREFGLPFEEHRVDGCDIVRVWK